MSPTLREGDWALAIQRGSARGGEVVVVEHPQRPGFELVKRVVAGPGGRAPDGRGLQADEIWVEGDASHLSSDSRSFGPIRTSAIRAWVLLVYWPPSRFGRVRVRV